MQEAYLSAYFGLGHAFLTKVNHFLLLTERHRHVNHLFTSTLTGHYRVIKWPNFYTVSQGLEKPEEKEKMGNGLSVEQSEHTHLSIKFSFLSRYG